jgi:hypothetical protein
MVQKQVVEVKYCPTEEMVADILTKPLSAVKLSKFRDFGSKIFYISPYKKPTQNFFNTVLVDLLYVHLRARFESLLKEQFVRFFPLCKNVMIIEDANHSQPPLWQ